MPQSRAARSCGNLERACAGPKILRIDSDTIQKVDEQIAQRSVVRFVVGHVTPVSVSAASKDDGQIAWVVRVRVAKVTTEQYGRFVEY
jgi:hypothetical protein